MEDPGIIALFFRRDERAVAETEEKYGRLCHSIAYRVLQSREDAEECVNDTWAALWNAIPPARPQNLAAFACRITRNLALKKLSYLKREKRSPDVLLSLEELEGVLPDERTAPALQEERVGELISRFLHTQKEEARLVFLRRYYFFDSIEEIAHRFGFTESKVKSMLFYTRRKLKKYLIKEGIEP